MLSALALPGAAQGTFRTPYSMREALRLEVPSVPPSVPRYGVLDLPIDATGSYDDPFDPTQVRLDAKVTEADGRTYSVPGFLSRAFRRDLESGDELLEPDGPVLWHLRVSPRAEGEVRVRITFADASGEKVQNVAFRCVASTDPGFVRVGQDDRRFFAFDNGQSYWPLGANLPSAGSRGRPDYEGWLGDLGRHGANYVRLSLGPSWSALAQELPGRPEDGRGVGQFDLANAWRLDRVLETARQKGIYAMLCLDDAAELRQDGPGAWWAETPQNSDHGGPLRIWRDFWSNETMDRLYRNRLRYLVARYGADSHVFGWEFWNEADRVSEFDIATVRDWHQRMARYLDGIDAYRHLRSTSLAATAGIRSIDLIPELDLVQSHTEDASDPAGIVAAQQSRKSGWGKPHLFGRVSEPTDVDPEGLAAHDATWVSIATAASGAAMPWGLERHAEGFGLYDAPSRFLAGIDWRSERFRQTDVALSSIDPKALPPRGDLVLEGGTSRGPLATIVSDGRLLGPMPPSILHGAALHPELHNPLVLRVRVDRTTRFEIDVSTVSGSGGANLRIGLDGAPALSRDFPVPDGTEKSDELRNHAGTYPIVLAKGVHTLRIENTGTDWVKVEYRLLGVVPRRTSLNAWAVVGDATAMAWVRLAGRTWRAVAEQRRAIPPAPPSVMRLRGLRSGTWRTEVWDTWAGKPLSTLRTRVGIEGTVRIVLPRIEKDVAVKLVREGK